MTFKYFFLIVLFIKLSEAQKCETVWSAMKQFVCTGINKFENLNQTTDPFLCINCNIPVLDESVGDYRGYMFNVSHSHVKIVKKGAFVRFSVWVSQIILDHNEIENIEVGTFNVHDWTTIDLSSNKLTDLHPKLFDGVSVNKLDLSENRLKDVSFVDGLKVVVLNLTYNEIENVPTYAFGKVKFESNKDSYYDHYAIVLSWNRIHEIEKNAFVVQGLLEHIILNNNQITIVKNYTFQNLQITNLDLSHNRINTLESKAFIGLFNLEELYLQNNFIHCIEKNLFNGLNSLKVLRLDNNHIGKFESNTFWSTPNILVLNVTSNYLENLPPTLLAPLINLWSFYIGSNRLTSLNLKEILKHNKGLTRVYVERNFWHCKELIENYKLLCSNYDGGIKAQFNYFSAPNFHGIPCSREPINSIPNNFEEFLDDISTQTPSRDSFEINVEQDPMKTITPYVNGIYCMLIILTLIKMVVWTKVVVQKMWLFSKENNTCKMN